MICLPQPVPKSRFSDIVHGLVGLRLVLAVINRLWCSMRSSVGCVRASICIASFLGFAAVFAGANATEVANGDSASLNTGEPSFLNGSTPSRLVADVSALMIAVDGKVQPDEVAFAYKLGQNVNALISDQGLWPVTEDMLAGFSNAEYEAQLKADLLEIESGKHDAWSAHRMADGAYDIINAAKTMGDGEITRTLVSAASNVWAKQSFVQDTLQETHAHIKQRERVNSYF